MYPSATLYTAYQTELSKNGICFVSLQVRMKENPPKISGCYECLFVESVMEYMSNFVKIIQSKILISIDIVPVVQLLQKVQGMIICSSDTYWINTESAI